MMQILHKTGSDITKSVGDSLNPSEWQPIWDYRAGWAGGCAVHFPSFESLKAFYVQAQGSSIRLLNGIGIIEISSHFLWSAQLRESLIAHKTDR